MYLLMIIHLPLELLILLEFQEIRMHMELIPILQESSKSFFVYFLQYFYLGGPQKLELNIK